LTDERLDDREDFFLLALRQLGNSENEQLDLTQMRADKIDPPCDVFLEGIGTHSQMTGGGVEGREPLHLRSREGRRC